MNDPESFLLHLSQKVSKESMKLSCVMFEFKREMLLTVSSMDVFFMHIKSHAMVCQAYEVG